MPGGRLTRPERQQIAQGVADGLPYAEIARRLGRPTSTITREVLRNGGAAGYRADRAQRSAEHRVRQPRRPPGSPVSGPAYAYGRNPHNVAEYERALTAVLVASGLPTMSARVLTCLFTSDSGSVTAADLTQRLQVSPASVSKAIGFLESQSLVRRVRDQGRRDRYVIDDELFYQATIATARANDQLIELARHGAAVLGRETPAAQRLANIARFLDIVSQAITRGAEEARVDLRARQPDPAGPAGPTR
jgi:predicted transcriptional regulator